MKWKYYPLKKVAPSSTSKLKFNPNDQVWHLNLDQIESHTGNILEKKRSNASSAGNSTYVFDSNNVLYSKLRPYLNKVVCPDGPGIATTELVPLCPQPEILDRKFLTYFLRSNRFLNFASAMVAGAKMPRVVMTKFWEYEIPLPTLTEQRRIVEILDQADRLRKLRAEADKKAVRILPALFIKMFGDPATNPMGWETTTFNEIIKETRNGLYKPAKFYGSGIGILKMYNILNGDLNLSRIDLINVEDKEYKTYCLLPGDILINRVNTPELVGKSAVITEDVGKAVFESKNIRLRVNRKKTTPEYITHYLNSHFGQGSLKGGVKHAIGMATINNTDLRNTFLVLPPLDLQVKWSLMVQNVRNNKKDFCSSANKIEELFKNLLHRAFTGDLTASWRQANMKELLQEMELQAKALNN